jgi:hypothetical protein
MNEQDPKTAAQESTDQTWPKAARLEQVRLCDHEWEYIQSVPGSGRRCRKCGLTECD